MTLENVVLTGATGFIGSFLTKLLLEKKIKTTIIVRKIKNEICDFMKDPLCTVIVKDIRNVTEADFNSSSYDAFIHLAWAGVESQNKNNVSLQLENIEMSIKALELAYAIGCKKFIASGTVAEYVFCNGIMDLNAKQTPNDMYGVAKVSAHYFLEVRARQLDMPFIWMVISSTFGPGRVVDNIITYTIRELLKGEKPLYGHLRQMWDFLYITDAVNAIYLIAEKGKTNKVYGIGSGNYRSLREYIEEIRDIINPHLELGIGEVGSMDSKTFSSCVNIYDLQTDTGFVPQVNFENGIKKTIDYIQSLL